MTTALFTYYEVSCKFDWHKENDSSTFTFGSLEGANKWIENNKEHIDWVTIMGQEVFPCKENDIGGQL